MKDGREPADGEAITSKSSVHVLLNPLAEELRCAVSTRGDGFKVFPGLEAYANLEHVRARLGEFLVMDLVYRVKASLVAVANGLDGILAGLVAEKETVAALVTDFTRIRQALAHHDWPANRVRAAAMDWVWMLRKRLARRDLENDPAKLKRQECGTATPPENIWQEWIRLHYTHEKGIYIPYNHPELGFTNNMVEWDFGGGRHRFRKLFGRGNVGESLVVHGQYYLRACQLELTGTRVQDILIAADRDTINDGLEKLRNVRKRTRRPWKIREKDTGNLRLLETRLRLCAKEVAFVG